MPRSRRAFVFYSLILFLLIQCLPLGKAASHVSAASAGDPVRILEITESGKSDLSLGAGYQIDTFPMKRFVALRTDIDGLYDAVYIGKGLYSPEGMTETTAANRQDKHNTLNKLNDITNLKAQAILDGYVNKGLLVLLYSDAASKNGLLYQQTSAGVLTPGVLNEKFSPFSTASGRRDNVLYINAAGLQTLAATLSQPKYASMLNQRPQLKLTASPVNYSKNPNQIYRSGETLSFQFEKPDRSGLRTNLYLNQDSSLPYATDQIVATSDTSGPTGSLEFRLPRGFSGLYYWKLELLDMESGLKSYTSGIIRFRDKQTQISVLQVMPNNDASSALTSSTRMNQSYLTSDDYKISIRTIDMTGFNRKGTETSYDMIGNGRYDMLIFGFKDSYNTTAGISQAAADAVKDFIGTGQSVMFTHDTVFISGGTTDNIWTSNFKTITGQTKTYTNIGYGAPLTSTTVQNVNDGLLTRFPFNLITDSAGNARTPEVAKTHDQYFVLDLEDPSIVPWYNISGGLRDDSGKKSYDSYNHYYTYSKGNVTYSGTGHDLSFPPWEQQLFVNTMYRAYMGSNHKPELNVQLPVAYSAAAANIIPAYQDIPVSFTPEDLDLNDRKLQAKVEFTYTKNGKKVTETKYQSSQALSGALISESYSNPLPQGGDIEVKISVQDKQGARSEISIPVKIEVVSANLEVSRSIDGLYKDPMAIRGKDFQLNYRILPKPVQNRQGEASRMVIASPVFTEKLPANIEVSGLPSGFTKSGTLAEGYTISGNLADIQYRPDASGSSYSADPISFTVTANAAKTDRYSMNAAALSFRNIGQLTPSQATFNAVSLEAVVPLTKLEIAGAELGVGDSYKLIPVYEPADATITRLNWSSSNPSAVSVTDTGIVTGLQQGTRSIITVTDKITDLSSSAEVMVIQTGLTISVKSNQLTYVLGSRIDLQAALVKSTGRNVTSNAIWTVSPLQATDMGIEDTAAIDSKTWSGSFYPTVPKRYTIKAVVNTTGGAYESNTLVLDVVEPDLTLTGPNHIVTGDNRAQWSRSWGDIVPVGDPSRPLIYRWSWSPLNGASGALSGNSDSLSRKMEAIAPGSGILRLEALQKLRAGDKDSEAITLSIRTINVNIVAKPELAIGKSSLLPSQTSNLAIRWAGAAPPYSVSWTAGNGLDISDSSNAGATLTALKPVSPAGSIEAIISMRDTGYTFPLQTAASVRTPILQINGIGELLLSGQSAVSSAIWSSGEDLPLSPLSWSLGSGAARVQLTPISGSPGMKLNALSPGPVTLQAGVKLTDAYTVSASKVFTVVDYRLAPSLTLIQKDTIPLDKVLTVLPDKSYYAKVSSMLTWTSSNPNIADVSQGQIVAKNRGTATLTAKYGQTDVVKTIQLTVTAPSGDRY
ncbi:DUF5057 domain-containing protein [Paenibacillus sp. D51F]